MPGQFLEVHYSLRGGDQVLAGFGQTMDMFLDWRPAFEEMYRAFRDYEEQVFSTEGQAGQGQWAPLSPRYKEWKERHFPGRPILTRTGRLRQNAKNLIVMTPDRVAMGPGNTVPYAIFHEEGTRRMPQRMFLKPNQALLLRFQEITRMRLLEIRRRIKDVLVGFRP